MAQLIKLLDYISRYETNPFHYPSQYIRLKQENWDKLYKQWEAVNEEGAEVQEHLSSQPKSGIFRWNPFKKQEVKEEVMEKVSERPRTKMELTHQFLNRLYPLQLKWATSTISHTSFTTGKEEQDPTLRYFLQRFPDIYLLMYYPIFNIKKAPIDGDIIMISPIGIEIISVLTLEQESTIVMTDDRSWTIQSGGAEKRIISPLISLKRTEQIVRSILKTHQIELKVEKTILAKNHSIVYTRAPYLVNIVDAKNYEDWFNQKRSLSSSLKSVQLKATEVLLHHCQTTSVRRPEWEAEKDEPKDFSFGEE